MPDAVTDTHALIWYIQDDKQLSSHIRNLLLDTSQAGYSLLVPSICLVEITYLIEKSRFDQKLIDIIERDLIDPLNSLKLATLNLPITRALKHIHRDQVPDMPDRIIAATALALDLPLVTRDSKIRASNITTVW